MDVLTPAAEFTPTQRRQVLVTGATRGIGRAIVCDLGRDWHVIVGGRDPEAVNALVTELPSAEPFVCDLSDEEATARAAGRLARLDALVHSAGIIDGYDVPVAHLTRAELRRTFEVNVFAVADLTRLLLPLLRESPLGQVLTINSGAGTDSGTPGTAAYSGSKHALRVLTDALRAEERGRVRVTSIHPGRTDTDMQREIQVGRGNDYDPAVYLRPESVAATVRLALDATSEAQVEVLSIRPVVSG